MSQEKEIIRRLRRLCILEREPDLFLGVFTEGERQQAILLIRQMLPASILKHHEWMMQHERSSIVPVHNCACSYCGFYLSVERLNRLKKKHDLEICDHCDAFLYLPKEEAVASGHRPKKLRH